MNVAEIVDRGKRFADVDIRRMYVCVSIAAEWMKETGGTLDELLQTIEKTCAKKPGCI